MGKNKVNARAGEDRINQGTYMESDGEEERKITYKRTFVLLHSSDEI